MPRTRQQIKKSQTLAEQPTLQDLLPAQQKKRNAVEGLVGQPKRKRTAFGDLTNAIQNVVIDSSKKNKQSSNNKSANRLSAQPELATVKECEPNSLSSSTSGSLTSSKESLDTVVVTDVPVERSKSRALSRQAGRSSSSSGSDSNLSNDGTSESSVGSTSTTNVPERKPKIEDIVSTLPDFDKEMINDPFHVPHYAQGIFQYYKKRENRFVIGDYLPRQKELNKQMRMILIDWMVEIQENFELNHETLYQAVKMTDLYLDKTEVKKENLQLVGSAALFVACKFDERVPPCADDFLYICDDAYDRDQLLEMERNVLNTLQFDIGMPSSYRCVRRYAKATKATMETLTLSRYILESSLMFYEYVSKSDSHMAAAAFLLALRMKKVGDWTPLHRFYSGFSVEEIEPLMWKLNETIKSLPSNATVTTVYTKYSHEVFFGVAKTACL